MEFKNIAVLDTNVLVDDYKAPLKYPDTLVVIPQVTIDELDGLKNSKDGSKRAMVRKASWVLDEITELNADEEIMALDTKGSYLKIESEYHNEFDALEPQKPDNMIISAAVGHAKANPKSTVTMYSNDVNVRVIARAVSRKLKLKNLKAERYSVVDTGLQDVATGVSNLFFPTSTINSVRNVGVLDVDVALPNNEHVFMVDENNIDNKLLATYDAVHKKLRTIRDWKKGEAIWGAGDDAVRPQDARQNFLMNDLMAEDKDVHFILSKVAGAGKNFVTTACALNLLKQGRYDRYILIKPMVEIGDELGLLPGTKEEKMAPWFESFNDTFTELTNDQQSLPFDIDGRIELDVVTHMRGRSMPNVIIHLDEVQNMTEHTVKTVLTRAGKNVKVILSGDLSQIDNPRLDSENNGLRIWAERSRNIETGFPSSTYIMLESNFRSDLSAWASSFYE